MALLEYKCPNCGGALEFDAAAQELVCPYCDSVISMDALRGMDENLETAQQSEAIDWGYEENGWREGEQDGMAVYACKSCGGEIVGDMPVDMSLYRSWFLKLFGIPAVVCSVLAQLIIGALSYEITSDTGLIAAGAAILLPLLFALGLLSKWKRELTSVRKDNLARAYIREGSMVLSLRRDDFLYRHVDKTKRAQSGGAGASGKR
jgi:DNA-directed RNA polymerase subunit RPC12/RpoP